MPPMLRPWPPRRPGQRLPPYLPMKAEGHSKEIFLALLGVYFFLMGIAVGVAL